MLKLIETMLKLKQAAAFIITAIGISHLGFYLQKKLLGGFVRVVNYHDTPAAKLEQQLKYFAKNYSNVTLEDLEKFLETKKWHKNKPGLIISFDDGLSSNFDTALPLLEKYGFTGWFFICPGFIDSFNKQEFAEDNSIIAPTPYTPTWQQLKKAAKKHVIGSHTMTHKRFGALSSSAVKFEIQESKKELEKNLKQEIKCFAWVGGEIKNYTKGELPKKTYEFIFQTNSAPITPATRKHQLQRTNIESFYPLYLVKFQLSGIMDILYWPKRKIVEWITA